MTVENAVKVTVPRTLGDRHPTVTCSMMGGEVMVACPRPRCCALRPRGAVVFIQAFDVE